MNILDKIVEHKKKELEILVVSEDLGLLVRDFSSALRDENLSLIAEIKRRSPSNPDIFQGDYFNPAEIAKEYEEAGVSCISVLTDEHFFGGKPEFLTEVKKATKNVPILAKDFFISKEQILDAKNRGADAVLLIVRILGDEQLAELYQYTKDLGISALVEVANEKDVQRALVLDLNIIGINSRDLDTFEIKKSNIFSLARRIREGFVSFDNSQVEQKNYSVVHRNEARELEKKYNNDFFKNNAKSDNIYIGYAGRLSREKGLLTLLEVAQDIIAKNPKVCFVLAGKGEMQKKIEEKIEEYGIKNNFILLGFLQKKELGDFFVKIDIFVLLSDFESFGIVLLEAMNAGKPIVASNRGAISEIIMNEQNGILVPKDSKCEIISAMQKLIDSQNMRESMGRMGKKIFLSRFTQEKFSKNAEKIFYE